MGEALIVRRGGGGGGLDGLSVAEKDRGLDIANGTYALLYRCWDVNEDEPYVGAGFAVVHKGDVLIHWIEPSANIGPDDIRIEVSTSSIWAESKYGNYETEDIAIFEFSL